RVAVSALKTAYHRKTFASVLAHNQCSVGFEEAVRILWIHNEIREVERAPYHPLALVALVPGHSAVIGNEQRALWRFDKHINALRVRRRNLHRDPTVWFFRETLVGFLRDLRPGVAAIRGTEQSASRRCSRTLATG